LVSVVTDSAANLPADLAAELGIRVVPLHLTMGDQVFRDGVDIVMSQFYEQLQAGAEVATTSAPSPGDFLEEFRGIPESEDVVCVTVASAVSATHQAARGAASELPRRRIHVVDSTNASMAEGFVALEAARLARAGASAEDVVGRAQDVATRSRILATIDTFEFLRRSGRVRRAQAYAATMLNIKPVFRFLDGDAEGVARPRTRSRALERIVKDTVSEADGRPLHLAAFHALAEGDAKELVRRVEAEAHVEESYVVEATPVIGAHTGPGLVGTAFFWD
jgi:fatty acid kinase fatty acid binding subunit